MSIILTNLKINMSAFTIAVHEKSEVTCPNFCDGQCQAHRIVIEDDGGILLSSIQTKFPTAIGLRFKGKDGCIRSIRTNGKMLCPPRGMGDWTKHGTTTNGKLSSSSVKENVVKYFCVYPSETPIIAKTKNSNPLTKKKLKKSKIIECAEMNGHHVANDSTPTLSNGQDEVFDLSGVKSSITSEGRCIQFISPYTRMSSSAGFASNLLILYMRLNHCYI